MSCDSPETKWSTTERDILEATYKALLKHGYAEISITSIGDELDKSKSSIYLKAGAVSPPYSLPSVAR